MLRIAPLGPSNVAAFEVMARRTAPLSMCWCQHWRLRSKDFAAARVPELRARLRDLAGGPSAPGLVAFDSDGPDARVVGWVGLGPRSEFERIVRSRVIPTIDDRPVWVINCFAVPGTERGRGIAAALLDGAIAHIRVSGAEAVEAYPILVPGTDGVNPDAAFTGTWPMFERAGFSIVAERASDPSATYQRVVARLELSGGGVP